MDTQNMSVSESMTFGTYPQTAEGTDCTPIQWLVLEKTGETWLLLSKYILDCKRYHSIFSETSWQDCDLRWWLNDEFYNLAFTDAEKTQIQTTHNTNHGEGVPDTDDTVFLLNAATVTKLTAQWGKDFLRARGTEFARGKKADGCHLYVMDKNVPNDYIVEEGRTHGCSWWWLRDQGQLKETGNDPARAVFIGTRATIRHYARVNQTGDGVRPAIKIRL